MAHLGRERRRRAHGGAPRRATRSRSGLVPAGTGNDFARSLGLDPDDVDAATAALARGRDPAGRPRCGFRERQRATPTGGRAAGSGPCSPPASTPWSTPAPTGCADRAGSARYTIAVLAELRTFRPLRYALVLDGVPRDLEAMFVAVGNTSSYGGGLRICPAADPYDGWLDVTVIHPVGRAKLLQLLPQMKTGRFASDPCVEQLRARTVQVSGGAGIALRRRRGPGRHPRHRGVGPRRHPGLPAHRRPPRAVRLPGRPRAGTGRVPLARWWTLPRHGARGSRCSHPG